MSYNYDQCVQSVREHRRKAYRIQGDGAATSIPDLEALQQSMDEFASLSKHCPMTPLLWMQYAHDMEMLMIGLYSLESTNGESSQQLMECRARKEALESSTGILELALSEFPGCALLHLYYLETLAEQLYQDELSNELGEQSGMVGAHDMGSRSHCLDKLSKALEAACQNVGLGTHVNEGMIVTEIYRFYGAFLMARLSMVVVKEGGNNMSSGDMEVDEEKEDESLAIFQQLSTLFQLWSQTPMGEGSNDEMIQDLEWFWDEALAMFLTLYDSSVHHEKRQQMEQQKELLWETIDSNRKKVSSLMSVLSSYENDLDVALGNEGIMLPRYSLFPKQDEKSDDGSGLCQYLQSLHRSSAKWDPIIIGDVLGTSNHRFLMGLGGNETSQAFSNYASSLQRNYRDVVKQGSKSKSDGFTPLQNHLAKHKFALVASLYERAVSECPTVETIWVSYIYFLRGEWVRIRKESQQPASQQDLTLLTSMVQTTTQRSLRNCPFSITLFELRMTTLGLVSLSNLEPDDISAVVQEAVQLGFLSQSQDAMLYLRLVAINVVKRKLLSLLSVGSTSVQGLLDYDQEEVVHAAAAAGKRSKTAAGSVIYQRLDPTILEEVKDLLEDIRDMYDEADSYLFKSHPKWDEGKRIFWTHRATSEASVLCPLGLALHENDEDRVGDNGQTANDDEVIRCFEKLVKAQKPCHPDAWREYLQYVSSSHLQYLGNGEVPQKPDEFGAVPSVIRKTRGLYNRAMSAVRKAGQVSKANVTNESSSVPSWISNGMMGAMASRDYDLALSELCREYVEFERNFGTEENVSHALAIVRSKLANWDPAIAAAVVSPPLDVVNEMNGKRKIDANDSAPEVAATLEDEMNKDEDVPKEHSSKRMKVKTDLKQPKKTEGVHKVRVGKLDYPAHPYTIHVSKLDKETEDMDLVDVFRKECGPVVHAKILREKVFGKGGHHFHGESKCAGLVQFEERMAVEKALEQDGSLEIDGKVVKINRSHLPAVGLVPQGCHRVKPKGEGRSSKRNMQKKKSNMHIDSEGKMDIDEQIKDRNQPSTNGSNGQTPAKKQNVTSSSPGSLSFDVLSFKPRNIKQKPKIALGAGNKAMKK